MPLDYETVVPAPPRIGPRFVLVAFGGGVVGLLAWCGLDLILVRFAPAQVRSFDWIQLLFPFVVGFAGAVVLRRPDSSPRLGLAVLAAVVASIVAVGLILSVGVVFPFAIGRPL